MKMPDDTLDRVRAGWSVAASMPDVTARAFYAHLFRTDPSTVPLFRGDMALQGRKLVDTISFIVDHLEDADTLLPAARDLAIRHVSYGVTEPQYASVGAALIATLRQLLGTDFTPEDEAAWSAVYDHLATAMVSAAYPAPA